MSDTTYSEQHVAFGVGSVISETFSIFFRKIHVVLLLGIIPALIELIYATTTGASALEIDPTAGFDWSGFAAMMVGAMLISSIAIGLTSAMVIQLAYDAKLGRSARIGSYFAAALVNLPAIAVLSLVSGLLAGLAMMLLILPGLWVYAVFCVIVPAIVIDKAGFGALGRSARLTKDYRWPIIGLLVLLVLILILLGAVIGFLFAAVLGDTSMLDSGAPAFGPWLVTELVLNALGYGWMSVAVAMIFARLKEIKEGVSVSDLVDVFK